MTTTGDTPQPQGELLLRTMPLPADTSFNGDIFGGWIMAQMDIAGSIMAWIYVNYLNPRFDKDPRVLARATKKMFS